MTKWNVPAESFRCTELTGAPAAVALRPVMQRSSHPGEARAFAFHRVFAFQSVRIPKMRTLGGLK